MSKADEEVFELVVPAVSGDNYAEQVKAYRKKYRLTQKALSEQLGVKEGTIWSWEKGHSKPRCRARREYREKLDIENV